MIVFNETDTIKPVQDQPVWMKGFKEVYNSNNYKNANELYAGSAFLPYQAYYSIDEGILYKKDKNKNSAVSIKVSTKNQLSDTKVGIRILRNKENKTTRFIYDFDGKVINNDSTSIDAGYVNLVGCCYADAGNQFKIPSFDFKNPRNTPKGTILEYVTSNTREVFIKNKDEYGDNNIKAFEGAIFEVIREYLNVIDFENMEKMAYTGGIIYRSDYSDIAIFSYDDYKKSLKVIDKVNTEKDLKIPKASSSVYFNKKRQVTGNRNFNNVSPMNGSANICFNINSRNDGKMELGDDGTYTRFKEGTGATGTVYTNKLLTTGDLIKDTSNYSNVMGLTSHKGLKNVSASNHPILVSKDGYLHFSVFFDYADINTI